MSLSVSDGDEARFLFSLTVVTGWRSPRPRAAEALAGPELGQWLFNSLVWKFFSVLVGSAERETVPDINLFASGLFWIYFFKENDDVSQGRRIGTTRLLVRASRAGAPTARRLLPGVLVRGQAAAASPAAASGYASPSLVPKSDSPGVPDAVSGQAPSPGVRLCLSPQSHPLCFPAESPAQGSGTRAGHWLRCPQET